MLRFVPRPDWTIGTQDGFSSLQTMDPSQRQRFAIHYFWTRGKYCWNLKERHFIKFLEGEAIVAGVFTKEGRVLNGGGSNLDATDSFLLTADFLSAAYLLRIYETICAVLGQRTSVQSTPPPPCFKGAPLRALPAPS